MGSTSLHPERSPRRVAAGLLFVACVACVCAGCSEPLDFEREQATRGTFGQEVHAILHKDLARAPDGGPQRAQAFEVERASFVEAIDAALPPERLAQLGPLLERLLPIIDSGMIPDLARKLAVLLDEVAADAPLREALARVASRPQRVDAPGRPQLVARLMAFDRLPDLTALLIDLVHAHDGRVAEGRVESRAVMVLIEALIDALTDLEVSDAPDRFLAIAADALLTEDPAFAPEVDHAPLWATRLDHRGLPRVAYNDIGAVAVPFIDRDGDGLADVDDAGRFLDFDGQGQAALVPFGAPGAAVDGDLTRDHLGRLLARDGTLAFALVDLHATALGYLLREARALVADDVPFDLAVALRPALGGLVDQTDARGGYLGHDPTGPLVGVAAAALTALDHADAPALLEALLVLLRDHPDALAGVLRGLDDALDTLDAHPSTVSEATLLLDRLLPILRQIAAQPGMLEDVLAALGDPMTGEAARAMARLMRWRSDGQVVVEKDGPYDACYQACAATLEIGTFERLTCIQSCPADVIFAVPVDPDAPPSLETRSLFERTLSIIWEATGQPYVVSFERLRVGEDFDLIEVAQALGDAMVIEDMAVAYLKTITGELLLEDVINPELVQLAAPLGLDGASVSGIIIWLADRALELTLDERPTPGQLVRMFNLYPLAREEPDFVLELSAAVCRSGRLCYDANADALFAVEASGLVDGLHPLATAFSRHDRLDLLADLLAVLYEHYPSAETLERDALGVALDMPADDLRSLEPALAQVIEDGALFGALEALVAVALSETLEDGRDLLAPIAGLVRHVITPDEALTRITGEASVENNAGEPISPLSPLDVVLAELDRLDAALRADPAADAAWDRAVDRLIDLLLGTLVDPATGRASFARPGTVALARVVVAELHAQLVDLEADGERSQTLRVDLPADLGDLVAARPVPALLQLLDWLEARDGGRALTRDLLLHLLEPEAAVSDHLVAALHAALAELLDSATVEQLGRGLALALDPTRAWPIAGPRAERSLLEHVVDLLDETRALDPDDVLLEIIRSLASVGPDGALRLSALGRAICQVHRREPGAAPPPDADDLASIMRAVADYLRDEERGAERLVGFVDFILHGQPEAR